MKNYITFFMFLCFIFQSCKENTIKLQKSLTIDDITMMYNSHDTSIVNLLISKNFSITISKPVISSMRSGYKKCTGEMVFFNNDNELKELRYNFSGDRYKSSFEYIKQNLPFNKYELLTNLRDSNDIDFTLYQSIQDTSVKLGFKIYPSHLSECKEVSYYIFMSNSEKY